MIKKTFFNILIPIICVIFFSLYVINAGQLTSTRNQLLSTQNELSSALNELEMSNSNLSLTEDKLLQTQSDLTQTENELSNVKNELDNLKEQLEKTNSFLEETKINYNNTLDSLNEEKILSSKLQSIVDNLQANIDSLASGYGYILLDPTYTQVKTFLAADKTDLKEYVNDTYVCEDFAYDVITNASQQKIRCAFVSIRYPDSAHAIIAFNTTDKGLIFIEPQSDEEVKLVIGKRFWQCIIPRPGYYYVAPGYDDTIIRYNVIW